VEVEVEAERNFSNYSRENHAFPTQKTGRTMSTAKTTSKATVNGPSSNKILYGKYYLSTCVQHTGIFVVTVVTGSHLLVIILSFLS
jgi:hypothetical protein